jgi:hypothetical protein
MHVLKKLTRAKTKTQNIKSTNCHSLTFVFDFEEFCSIGLNSKIVVYLGAGDQYTMRWDVIE